MKMKIYFLFLLFVLFPLKTEAVVLIKSNVRPIEEGCSFDSFPDHNQICNYYTEATGFIGSDDKVIAPVSGLEFYIGLVGVYRDGSHEIFYRVPLKSRRGTVTELAADAIEVWGARDVYTYRYFENPIVKACLAITDAPDNRLNRPEFGNECGIVVPPGPDPEPEPGSCDLGGPYYLSHGSMDVYDVNGNEARVNLNVSCTQDATLTFTAPNELDLGQNIVSQLTLDGQKPDGLKLEFSKPGRTLLFASKLQTIGTPETGTFDKVYLLQATIQ